MLWCLDWSLFKSKIYVTRKTLSDDIKYIRVISADISDIGIFLLSNIDISIGWYQYSYQLGPKKETNAMCNNFKAFREGSWMSLKYQNVISLFKKRDYKHWRFRLMWFFIFLSGEKSLFRHENCVLFPLRVALGLSVKLVRVDQKGRVGARGLQGLKERKATLDWKDHPASKETKFVFICSFYHKTLEQAVSYMSNDHILHIPATSKQYHDFTTRCCSLNLL